MIVISAPTSQIGRQVLDRALDGADQIRAIARDPSRLSRRVRERVEVVQGSHGDIDVVTEAFAGADSVFWLVPPNPRTESPKRDYLDFTRPACQAVASEGIRRLVVISSLGREFGADAGVLSAAFAMEELLESTGVSMRTLRMPFFMENLLNQVEAMRTEGTFFTANLADRPLATVATRDIAAHAAQFLLDDSWTGQEIVPVIGPDDLSPNEMAAVISATLARPLRCQQIPADAYKATMVEQGVSTAFAQGLVDMVRAQNQGIYDAEQQAAAARAPTGFRQWCQEVLKPEVEG